MLASLGAARIPLVRSEATIGLREALLEKLALSRGE
jgi:hypothetical protein